MLHVIANRAGRLLLALPFILGGWDALREPGARIDEVAAAGLPQPMLAVRANGLMMVLAGIALAFGRLPHRAAAMLALILVPTTLVGHAFWKESDPRKRSGQLAHFMKNLSMIGGLLMVMTARHEEDGTASPTVMKRAVVKEPV